MALVLADRVKETTTTAGTGTVTLLGAAPGFQSFAVIGNANTTYYTIAGQTTSEWEVGIGTYTASGTLLARTTVLSNSSGTQPSALSFSAGTKDVFVTYPAGKSVNLDASGNATALGTPAAFVGTNITGTASGLTAGNVTTNANLTGGVTSVGNATTVVTNANLTGGVTSVGNAATVVTNANLTGDVTSVGNATSIAAGVIVDADINASAGIVDTKLATISTASKVSNSATTATSANTANAIVARDASGNFTAGTVTAALTGNASTATTLATGRTIAITGDLAYTSGSFNGSGNVTGTGTLATVNSNVGSFTVASITVNAKGLITAASTGSAPAPTTAQVLSATAGAAVNDIGSYGILDDTTASTRNPGSTISGSSLNWASCQSYRIASPTPAGTWRLMGYVNNAQVMGSLWLRIS